MVFLERALVHGEATASQHTTTLRDDYEFRAHNCFHPHISEHDTKHTSCASGGEPGCYGVIQDQSKQSLFALKSQLACRVGHNERKNLGQ